MLKIWILFTFGFFSLLVKYKYFIWPIAMTERFFKAPIRVKSKNPVTLVPGDTSPLNSAKIF